MARALIGSVILGNTEYTLYQMSDLSIMLSAGNMRLLCSVQIADTEDGLAVTYRERFYANGKIPGGLNKREQFNNHEILTSRFIDKSLRPLLASDKSVNVSCTLHSHDPNIDPKRMSVWLSSIAIARAGVEIVGPVVAATNKHKIAISCTPSCIVACDLASSPLTVDQLEQAIAETISKSNMPELWDAARQFAEFHGTPLVSEEYIKQLGAIGELDEMWDRFATEHGSHHMLFNRIRNTLAESQRRADGRQFNEIRQIDWDAGVLPCSNGSALFSRGETQVLASVVSTTNERDALILETSCIRKKALFYVHYIFPSGRHASRREIGHSQLVYNGLKATIETTQPTRLVADVLAANGSSSMASVCAGSLALRNAGKTNTLAAGISIGLFGDTFVTDLTADEDAVSGMDLKVVGTHNGITAIQLDTKSNLQISQFFSALRLAQKHISDILGKMQTHDKCANSIPEDTAYPLSGALHSVAAHKKHTAQ